jgi:predicted dehydrogenase
MLDDSEPAFKMNWSVRLLKSIDSTGLYEQLMSKIKIGQIGTGHGHAAGKMEVFRNSTEFEVVGIVEPDPQLRKRAEGLAAFRDLPWLTVEQLLNIDGLQAVAIETTPGDLLNRAETCVEAGKHIHLDKPAGESLTQFRRILDTAMSRHQCVQMGYMYRYNPAVMLMKQLVKNGALGEPFEIHCVMSKVVDDANRREHGAYAGGMMFELGCHLIDVVVDLLGKPDRVTPYRQHVSPRPDALLDNMLAVLEYPKAIATVKSSGVEIDGGSRRQFTICGTEGTLHIQPLDSPKVVKLVLSRERGKYQKGHQDVAVEPYQRYTADAVEFASVIRGEKPLGWTPMHDLAVQETVLRSSGCPMDK